MLPCDRTLAKPGLGGQGIQLTQNQRYLSTRHFLWVVGAEPNPSYERGVRHCPSPMSLWLPSELLTLLITC